MRVKLLDMTWRLDVVLLCLLPSLGMRAVTWHGVGRVCRMVCACEAPHSPKSYSYHYKEDPYKHFESRKKTRFRNALSSTARHVGGRK